MLTTGKESVLYKIYRGSFQRRFQSTQEPAGRSVLAYDEGSRTIFFTSVPRNSVFELNLFSIHLGVTGGNSILRNPDLARLGHPASELKHCQVRLRHTFKTTEHVPYNAMSANCDGTVHIAAGNKLWLFNATNDIMAEITPSSMSSKSIRAVATSRPDSSNPDKKWIYFATASDIYAAKPNGANGALLDSDIEMLYSRSDATAPSPDCPYCESATSAPSQLTHTRTQYMHGA